MGTTFTPEQDAAFQTWLETTEYAEQSPPGSDDPDDSLAALAERLRGIGPDDPGFAEAVEEALAAVRPLADAGEEGARDAREALEALLIVQWEEPLTAAAFDPNQLRVPKGNGRMSGRWVDSPLKVVDDLLRALGETAYDDRADPSLQRAREAATSLDPRTAEGVSEENDFYSVSDQLEVAEQYVRDPRARDLVQAAAGAVTDLAELDWTLFSEDTDVRGGGIADEQATDIGSPSATPEGWKVAPWADDMYINATGWIVEVQESPDGVDYVAYDSNYDSIGTFPSLRSAARAADDAAGAVAPDVIDPDETVDEAIERTRGSLGEALQHYAEEDDLDNNQVLRVFQGMTARINKHTAPRGLTAVPTESSFDGIMYFGWRFEDAEGKPVGELKRQIRVGAREVENEYFILSKSHQGNGLANAMAAELEAWYADNGVERIRVHANIDVGGYCVPLRSRILTRHGWKKHDEVGVGESVLGFDLRTNDLRWTKVEEVIHFEALPMVRMSNARWSVDSTPNHRWLTRGWNGKQWGEFRLGRTTESLRCSGQRVVVSAPYGGEDTSGLTPDDAALLAWLVTDGNVHVRNRRGYPEVHAAVAQEKASGRAALATLGLTPMPRGFHVPAARLRALYETLHAPYGSPLRPLLEHAVLGMGTAQLEAFCEAGLLAEGDHDRPRFWQQPGAVAEAFALAFTLTGRHVTRTAHKGGTLLSLTASQNPYVRTENLVHEDLGAQPAWCPRTGLGTWVMEQDGRVMITGNTWAKQGFDRDPEEDEGVQAIVEGVEQMLSSVLVENSLGSDLWHARAASRLSEWVDPPDLTPEAVRHVAANEAGLDDDEVERLVADLEFDPVGVLDELLDAWEVVQPNDDRAHLRETLMGWAEAVYWHREGDGEVDLPTMYDLATFGQGTSLQFEEEVVAYDKDLDRETNTVVPMWPGKAALLGSNWHGVKEIG